MNPIPPSEDPVEPGSDDVPSVDRPQALSLQSFSFNFSLDTSARVRGLMGAPAFALRRKRLDRSVERFWDRIEQARESLWVAAAEGRIDDEGRELRPSLMNSDGRDRFAHLEQRKHLHRLKVDEGEDQVRLFNQAWTQYCDRIDFSAIASEVETYNRYFPIEANLPTDPETGRFVWKGRDWQALEAPDRRAVLDRFPLR